MSTAMTLSPSGAASALRYAIQAQQPTFLWGAPGIGKSDVVRQVAASLDRPIIDIRAILLDPVDLRGFPHLRDGLAHWAEPSFLPRSGQPNANAIVLLDELNRAPVLVQNGLFQLVLDRGLGEYRLPPDVYVLAAGNRESDGGGITRMPSALSNRFLHLEIEPDVQDWCLWALTANIEPLLIAFLRWRPELLHQFDRNARAFPSPRSWSFASRLLQTQPPKDLLLPLLAGTVGEGAAVEVLSYYDLFATLPSVDAILLSPTTAPVPGPLEAGKLWAIASALAHRATGDNLERVLHYTSRLPQEYNVFCVRDIVVRSPQLQSTPAFIAWAIAHQGVI